MLEVSVLMGKAAHRISRWLVKLLRNRFAATQKAQRTRYPNILRLVAYVVEIGFGEECFLGNDMPNVLTIWTIYKHPRDYPTKWVLRADDVPGGRRDFIALADTLEEIRAEVPPFLHRMPRNPADDPVIYETWI